METSIRLSNKRRAGVLSFSLQDEAEQETGVIHHSGQFRTPYPISNGWRRTAFPKTYALYMREKASFIEHLDDLPRSFLWYRPYMRRRNNLYDQAYIERRYPDVRILRGKLARYMPSRLSSALAGCGVCVLDRPGTTAAFAMATGIPTLFFGHQNAWRVSHHAKPYFRKLSSVNVHHSSGESAARHLNAIWPDVDSWWEDGRTREVVAEFAHRYYRSSKNWRAEWVEIFSSSNSEFWRTDKKETV